MNEMPEAPASRPAAPTLPGRVDRISVAGADLRCLRVGSGRPVVLLHTLRTQLEYFLPLIGQLDTTRLEAVVLDLPGHGESSAPPVDYTADYFTDAVEASLVRLDVGKTIVVGDSIGGTIGLTLAARANPRVAHVIAVNPYDYGVRGGIRRSSRIANLVFTFMLWPGIGTGVAGSGGEWVLRRVMEGGLHDRNILPASLIEQMNRCGARPGHARAFCSLHREWRTWIAARDRYPAIAIPTTLVYGLEDWSRPDERAANARSIPRTRNISLERCGHFASLEVPQAIARLIHQAAAEG